jgi:hypothetical protein
LPRAGCRWASSPPSSAMPTPADREALCAPGAELRRRHHQGEFPGIGNF